MAKSDLKILLVDDHDIVLRGMRHLIEDLLGDSCHVDMAKTAAEALWLTSVRNYDLCLLMWSFQMPAVSHYFTIYAGNVTI